jgi:hypothetical protein
MTLSGNRKFPEREVVWFYSSVANCLKYFSLQPKYLNRYDYRSHFF